MSDDLSIKLTGDNSDFNAKVDEAKRKVQGLGKETGDELDKGAKRGARAIDAYVKSLERVAANAGKSAREVKLEELAQRGATAEVIKRADAAMRLLETTRAQAREARKAEAAGRQAAAIAAAQGLSTKASRVAAFQATQLSYQLNDFFVQIASGQSPITALVQQGSQLSGTFGGLGNALKAVTGLLSVTRVAVGGLVATVGVLAYAFYRGAEDAKAFADAVVKSGNYAGQTEGQFLDLSRRVAESSDSTVGSVREISQALISTGQIGAESFSGATEAAVAYASITGKTAEDVAADFARMAKDPEKFAAELNKSLHFLTAAQYDQIKASQEQGRHADALKVIFDALNQRSERLKGNLHGLDRILHNGKKAWSDYWAAAVDSLRPETVEDKIRDVEEALAKFTPDRNPLSLSSLFGKSKEQLLAEQRELSRLAYFETEKATAESVRAETQQNAIATKSVVAGYLKRAKSAGEYLDKLAELKRAFKAQEDAGTPVSEQDQKTALAQLKKEFTPKGGPKERDPRKSQLALDLENIRNEADALTRAYDNAEKILEARRSARLVNDRDYYDAKAAFIRLNAETEERALEAEIARLEREKVAGADALDNARKIAEARAKLTKVKADAATNAEVLGIQQSDAIRRLAQDYIDAAAAAQAYIDTVKRQNARDIDGVGRGRKFRERQGEQNRVEDKFTAQRQALEGDLRRKQITPEQFDAYLAVARETYAQETALFAERTASIDAKNADGFNGMNEALRNYADEAQNVAAMTEDAFSGALSGIEDAFVNFISTGKLAFKDLANSIAADFARIGFRQMIGGAVDGLAGAVGATAPAAGAASQAAATGTATAALSGYTAALTAGTGAVAAQTAGVTGLAAAEATASAGITASSASTSLALTGMSAAATSAAAALAALTAASAAKSGVDAATTVVSIAGAASGGRAIGGPVSARQLYQVNERGPELLSVAGKQYLMMGGQGGKVEPVAPSKGGDVFVNVHVTPPAGSTRETAAQFGAMAGRQIQNAMRRNA